MMTESAHEDWLASYGMVTFGVNVIISLYSWHSLGKHPFFWLVELLG